MNALALCLTLLAAPEAMVVGTIHSDHLTAPGYPLQRLAALIDTFAPDLILVEIRPEAFAKNDLDDGPLEMAYVTELAHARGIAVEPIDWWLEQDIGAEPGETTPACKQELEAQQAHDWPPTFEQLHDDTASAQILRVLNTQARCYAGYPLWTQRQAMMHDRADRAISQHHAMKTLAFVGGLHRPELALYLKGIGSRVLSPLTLDRATLAAKTPSQVPSAVVTTWIRGAARQKVLSETTTGKQQESATAKAAALQRAIDQFGSGNH